jgi:hypothetical protein
LSAVFVCLCLWMANVVRQGWRRFDLEGRLRRRGRRRRRDGRSLSKQRRALSPYNNTTHHTQAQLCANTPSPSPWRCSRGEGEATRASRR